MSHGAAASEVSELLQRRGSAKELLATAAEIVDRYPVAVGRMPTVAPPSWELICTEEIRMDKD